MIRLSNAKNNRRLNEFDGLKEYVIQKNIDVKRIKNQPVIGEKMFVNERMLENNVKRFEDIQQDKMLFYFF